MISRNALADSKLAFKVYNEQATPRELVGRATVDLSSLMQKHRGKSMYFRVQLLFSAAPQFGKTIVLMSKGPIFNTS